jgi:hypothetical protein
VSEYLMVQGFVVDRRRDGGSNEDLADRRSHLSHQDLAS